MEPNAGIYAVEQAARHWTRAQCRQAANLVDRAGDLMAEAFGMLEGVKVANELHRLLLMLGVRSFNTLRLAHLAVLNGYPMQAVMLARALLEDRLIASWVLTHPDDVRLWLDPMYASRPHSKQVPGVAKLIGNLPSDAQPKVWEMYDTFSLSADSRVLGLSGEHESAGETWNLMVGPRRDVDHAFAAYYSLLTVVPQTLGILAMFVEGQDAAWAERRREWEQEDVAWLEAQNA